ncbi:MAG: hypothetical protein EXR58_05080 [Chloroflexi bacterium]|nr:hypothetical protein [Chloroflexota bacterium]
MTKLPNHRRPHALPRMAWATMATVLLLVACGPSGESTNPGASAGTARTAPKILNMAMQGEPETLLIYGRPTGASTLNYERWHILHTNLTNFEDDNVIVPHLAQKVPSLDDGDWKVNPDGTMEVTWKLKPNLVWHDGTPVSSEDWVFGLQVVLTKELTISELGELLKISSVRAPDPQTLVVNWKEPSFWANANGTEGIPVIPRHLLEAIYKSGDYPAVENSPLWNAGWVGLGPFRLTRVEVGSHIETEAFDRFVLGRPKIDRVIVHWVGDVNTVVARVLAGAIDLVPGGGMLGPEQIGALQKQWQDKGKAYTEPNSTRYLTLKWRDPNAPWVKDLRFRQAMIYGMNREQNLVQSLQSGLTKTAEYFILSNDPLYKIAEQRSMTKYPYDPTRSERLFAEAGWTRGPDKLLRNAAGETVPFTCCRLATADSNDVQESLAIVGELQAEGIQASHPLPTAPAGTSTADVRKFNALNGQGTSSRLIWTIRAGYNSFISSQIPTEENRWTGTNGHAYSNPTYDALFARSEITLKAPERQDLQLQMLKILTDELPSIPLFENPQGLAVREGVTGIKRRPTLVVDSSFNIYQWDMK